MTIKRLLLIACVGAILVACGGGRVEPTSTSSGKAEKVYTNRSSAMEPTLHCAKGPGLIGCLGEVNDRLVVRLTGVTHLRRQDIVVFIAPKETAIKCGAGGTYVKRVIGLPGETVLEDDHGFIDINGKRLAEPYIQPPRRLADTVNFGRSWHVPNGAYFMIGDNRPESCDSRTWGSVPASNIIGPVVQIVRGGKVLKPAGVP